MSAAVGFSHPEGEAQGSVVGLEAHGSTLLQDGLVGRVQALAHSRRGVVVVVVVVMPGGRGVGVVVVVVDRLVGLVVLLLPKQVGVQVSTAMKARLFKGGNSCQRSGRKSPCGPVNGNRRTVNSQH